METRAACVSVSSSGAVPVLPAGSSLAVVFLIRIAQTAGSVHSVRFPPAPLKITGRIRPAQLNWELFLEHLLPPVSLGLIACPAEQLLPWGEDAAAPFLLTWNKNMSGTKKKRLPAAQ